MTLHHDDLVKLGEFLNRGGHDLLDPVLYREALQRTEQHGLTAGARDSRYQHGFWAWNAASSEDGPALCRSASWIPYMSGYGGIAVVLLPRDMVYYFVSDRMEYGFRNTLTELNKIRSLCQSG
jgi:hypothetical protein